MVNNEEVCGEKVLHFKGQTRAENNHWEYSVSIFQKAINTFCSTKLSTLKNSCLSLEKNKQQNIRMSFAILSEPSQEMLAGIQGRKHSLH